MLEFKIKQFLRSILKRISNRLKKLRWWFIFNFFDFYNTFFNLTVLKQNKDYRKIPILIINFNQLEYLKKLVTYLQSAGYSNIVIIDNLSTYPPLLDYYKNLTNVTVYYNRQNQGHRVFWKNTYLREKYGKGYYVITDADVVPISECPPEFLRLFKELLDQNKKITKVGFSLEIEDIPIYNKNRPQVIAWEKEFWRKKTTAGHYYADIDTTFALYRPLNQFNINYYYPAIRTKYPYRAIHGGWYINYDNMTEEQKYYQHTASKSSSWRVDAQGNLLERSYIYKGK
jgi:hypothetical protein